MTNINFINLDLEEQNLINSLSKGIDKILSPTADDERKTSQYPNFFDHSKTQDSSENFIDVAATLLVKKIKKIDLSTVIKSALLNPVLDAHYHHPNLDEYWAERWRKSGRNSREKAAVNYQPIQEYVPQPTLHTFDLLKGIFLYSNYRSLKNIGDRESAEPYLQLAANLGNYSALSELFKRHFNVPGKEAAAFAIAQSAAKTYWTPGYILLAMIFYQQKNYKEALFHLIMAEKLIPHSESMIHNAYQGKPLEAVIQPLLSTLNAKDLLQVKIQLTQLAKLPTYFVTDTLYKEAHRKVQALLDSIESVASSAQAFSPYTNPQHSYNIGGG